MLGVPTSDRAAEFFADHTNNRRHWLAPSLRGPAHAGIYTQRRLSERTPMDPRVRGDDCHFA